MGRTAPHLLALAASILLTLAVYRPAVDAPFVYEDDHHAFTGVAMGWAVPGRGLTHWTYVAIGPDSGRQHLMNVAVHLLTGVALYGMTAAMASPLAGVFAATLWWLHPLNTEAVSYVSARGDLLVAFFSLSAVWCALTYRLRAGLWRLVLIPGTIAGAALSKEIGLMAVPLVLWTLVTRGALPRSELLRAGMYSAAGVLLGLVWHRIATWQLAAAGGGGTVFPLSDFVTLQAMALWHLLMLVIWPFGVSIDHDIVGLHWGWTVAAAVLTGLSVYMAAACWRRAPMVTWALGWLAIGVAPRVIVPTNEFLHEYYLYPAWLGLAVLMGMGLARLWTLPVSVGDNEPLGVGA